jgi:hypothetical protein
MVLFHLKERPEEVLGMDSVWVSAENALELCCRASRCVTASSFVIDENLDTPDSEVGFVMAWFRQSQVGR